MSTGKAVLEAMELAALYAMETDDLQPTLFEVASALRAALAEARKQGFVLVEMRCIVTGNPCGTDTVMPPSECPGRGKCVFKNLEPVT